MGKQVNFYMLAEDEQEFIRFLTEEMGAVLLSPLSRAQSPTIIDTISLAADGAEYPGDLYLWREGFPVYVRPGVMKAGPLVGEEVFFVKEADSYVVEFVRSYLIPGRNLLTRGRIWAEMRQLEGDRLVYKGEEFEKWYDSMAAWIRKRYRKIGTKPYFYIGPQAYEWHQAGGNLRPV
jgi:hypothetical protein